MGGVRKQQEEVRPSKRYMERGSRLVVEFATQLILSSDAGGMCSMDGTDKAPVSKRRTGSFDATFENRHQRDTDSHRRVYTNKNTCNATVQKQSWTCRLPHEEILFQHMHLLCRAREICDTNI